MEGEWFKLYAESAFAGWTSKLPNGLYGVWVKVLAVAKVTGRNGVTRDMRARDWLEKAGVTGAELEQLMAAAGDHITMDGGNLIIHNWREYQQDRTATERQTRRRSKLKDAELRVSRVTHAVTTENRREENREDNTTGAASPAGGDAPEELPVPPSAEPPPDPAAKEKSRRKRTPQATDPYADAFAAAYLEVIGAKYPFSSAADFVQLAAWHKAYPDVTPEAFAQAARDLWALGQFCPKYAGAIRKLCPAWSEAIVTLKTREGAPHGQNRRSHSEGAGQGQVGKAAGWKSPIVPTRIDV